MRNKEDLIGEYIKLLRQKNRMIEFLTEQLTEEQALEVPDLFETWTIGEPYKQGDRFKYGEVDGKAQLFKVVQNHTSQEQYIPGTTGTESLYTSLTYTEDGYEEWSPRIGDTNPYLKGQIVSFEGNLYISTFNGVNVWKPNEYGWIPYQE